MKVDGEIISLAAKTSDERGVGAQTSRRMRTVRDDDLIEVRIVAHDVSGVFFDDVRDVRGGEVAA